MGSLRPFLADFAAFAGRKGISAAILVALGALLEGLGLVLLVPLLGVVIGSGLPSGKLANAAAAAFNWFRLERPVEQLSLLLVVFGVLMILRAAVLYWRDVTVNELQTGFAEAQRLRLAESLAAAPWEQVARLRHARITQLMGGDIQRVGVAAFMLLRCAVAGVMLLAHCVLIFVLAPVPAALALVVLTVAVMLLVPAISHAHAQGIMAANSNLALLNSTGQFLGGLKLAISQNLQSGFVTEFKQTLRDLTGRQIDFVRRQTSRRLWLQTGTALAGGLLVLLGFAVFAIVPAVLIALLLIVARMSGPAVQIQQSLPQLAQALPVHARCKALERELAAMPAAATGEARPLPDGPIVFENVSYHHNAENGAATGGVDDIDLTINPREFVGIAGPSGAGKTTFADLLVGLLPPARGRITVGGVPLDGAALASWRNTVSYISQDPFLFHDTIRRNLTWANAPASEPEIWHALTLAGAGALVRGMAQRLETTVGERGVLLSGGERQRIALARAILRKPRLMILDEATSAIDVAGERGIFERLRALTPASAVVIIAHRPESLALCDRVLRFANGRCAGEEAASGG